MSFPRYPAYKDSGVEWLGEVPEHWKEKPLKTVTSINDEVLSESASTDHEIEYVDISSVSLVNGIERTESMIFGDAPSRARRIPRDGDVLVSTVRTYLKAIAPVVSPPSNLVASTGFAVVRPRLGIHPGYLKYALQEEHFVQQVISRSTGVSYPAINASDIARIRLSLPNQFEQLAIAAFLDRETAKIDALIAEQQRLIELLQEKRQAVISHAVTKGLNPDAPMKDSGVEWLGEVPEHWEVAQLNQLINKITNGYVGPTRDILQDEGIRYLQSLHIKNNKILFETPYYVSEEWSATKEKSILKEGDVLIVQTGDIGQSAVVTKEFEGCNCHALIVVAPRCNVLTGAWLSWVLNSAFGKETLLSIQTGALHPHLNCGNVKYISIPVSPIEEQTAICNYIAAKNLEADELICASCKSIELMKERRSALISAAVTGQIDVRGLVPEASAA
jgi:type I restriction enzyme S subunit